MLTVRIAGCALMVSVSVSRGPSKQRCEMLWPSSSSASSKVARATADSSTALRPIPTNCEPCPGNRKAIRFVILALAPFSYCNPATEEKWLSCGEHAGACQATPSVYTLWRKKTKRGPCERQALARPSEIGIGLGLFFDLDDLLAAVGAALWADRVGLTQRVALRAGNEIRALQPEMAAPPALLPFG